MGPPILRPVGRRTRHERRGKLTYFSAICVTEAGAHLFLPTPRAAGDFRNVRANRRRLAERCDKTAVAGGHRRALWRALVCSPPMASPRPGLGALGRSLALLAALALVAALAGCGSSSKSGTAGSTTATSAAKPADFQAAGALEPVAAGAAAAAAQLPRPAGQHRLLPRQSGAVTFVYTHCPDVCPLIISNLRVAQNLLGPKPPRRRSSPSRSIPRATRPRRSPKFLAQP